MRLGHNLRPLRRHQRRPHPYDDETLLDACIRCVQRGDFGVLDRDSLEALDRIIDEDDRYRGCEVHNAVRRRLGLRPVNRSLDWFPSSWSDTNS